MKLISTPQNGKHGGKLLLEVRTGDDDDDDGAQLG